LQKNQLISNLSFAIFSQNLDPRSIKSSLKLKFEQCNIMSSCFSLSFSYFLPDAKKKNAPGFTLVKNEKSSDALTGIS